MDFDFGEIEGYRSVYAQALIQLRKDLRSPVQQFFVSAYGSKNPRPYDWHVIVGSHLTALERDKREIEPSLLVPTLSFAVILWLSNRLLGFGMTSEPRRDAIQLFINESIQLRFDMIFGQGDPLLAAVLVLEYPETVRELTRNVGLGAGKAEEIVQMFIDEATPLALLAWNHFRLTHDPVKRSMFRPSAGAMEQLRSRTYENTI